MQQVNVSRSKRNVIRGIHISGFPKVVFCPVGKVFDVVVDMRPDSPTFKKWCGAWLDRKTHIICPSFCAHGVFAAEEESVICYYQGGTFFPHLDYAISGKDPALAIQWPTPIGANDYVMSVKDLSSEIVGPAIWDKISAARSDPIAEMHRTTNSDVVVCCDRLDDVTPLMFELRESRGHLLRISAMNRESLHAAITSLRPRDGVIYFFSENQGRSQTDELTELLNIIHICEQLQHHLVIITESNSTRITIISDLIAKERPNEVALLIGQCILHKGLTKTEAAIKLSRYASELEKKPTFTYFDELASFAVKMLREKKFGTVEFVNPGTLDFDAVKEFCHSNGVDFSVSKGPAKLIVKEGSGIGLGECASDAFACIANNTSG
jgi:dTDP-4-dehydrorhamnose 3,5-epimerase-like enzyme